MSETEKELFELGRKLIIHQPNAVELINQAESNLISIENNSVKLINNKNDTECGIGCFRIKLFQNLSTPNVYIIIYSIMACMVTASAAYFSGTITTIEKRFKIPSKTTAIIAIGNHIAQLFVAGGLSYYTGKGHRPRWIAIGTYTIMLHCLVAMMSHFFYGPGDNALQLTKEYGGQSSDELFDFNSHLMQDRERKFLCNYKENSTTKCEKLNGNFAPQVLLFFSRVLFGIGDSIISTLGISYIDDNIPKAKAPALLGIIYFIKMIGPVAGYALSSITLNLYIVPSLHPIINQKDPRWLGAWWLGWIVFAIIFFIFGSLIGQFPKKLSKKLNKKNLVKKDLTIINNIDNNDDKIKHKVSWNDLKSTIKRLLSNGTLICNNLASVFFLFGFLPFWIYMPKYIETQYKQSASVSALITGGGAVCASTIGFLLSGIIITKYKPRARYLATWNIICSIISVIGIISYAYIGCSANDNQLIIMQKNNTTITQSSCNNNCHCDFVTYNPVCSDDGNTFISACHAGCQNITINSNGIKKYTNCTCRKNNNAGLIMKIDDDFGTAVPGACPIDCQDKLYIFLAIVLILNLTASAGASTRFLVPLRCVEKRDKPVAMGFGMTILSLCALIPAPIVYGAIFDKTCLVWGKTCTGTGNCWMYDAAAMRYLMNFTSAGFLSICIFFDIGVWYFIKDVKMFD